MIEFYNFKRRELTAEHSTLPDIEIHSDLNSRSTMLSSACMSTSVAVPEERKKQPDSFEACSSKYSGIPHSGTRRAPRRSSRRRATRPTHGEVAKDQIQRLLPLSSNPLRLTSV